MDQRGSHAAAIAATAPKTSAPENMDMEKWWVIIQCIAQYPEDDSVNTILKLLSLAINCLAFTSPLCLSNSLTFIT